LEGRVHAQHRCILTELWGQIDHLDEPMARFDAQIAAHCAPFAAAVGLLDTLPGVARQTAEIMVAELGTDMSRFPTADPLAAWAGVAPGNHESAGKQRSGQTRKGHKPLGVALNQAAHAASRTRHTYVSAQYRRLAGRRGKKNAIVAVAHAMVVIASQLLQRHESYREWGGDYFEKQRPEATAKRLVKRLERFGYAVTLPQKPITGAA
jgi:transposase